MIRRPIKRISFDFDGVLSTPAGQNLAARKMREKFDVWILTARREDQGEEVMQVAEKLGIPASKIVFTEGHDKWKYIERLRIDQHYDNNTAQVAKINTNTHATGTWWQAQK